MVASGVAADVPATVLVDDVDVDAEPLALVVVVEDVVAAEVVGVLDEPPHAARSNTGTSINEYESRRIMCPSSRHVVVRSYDD